MSMPKNELRLYAHTPLFYWWPVWAAGFGLGAWSLFLGRSMRLEDQAVNFVQDSLPGFLFLMLIALTAFVSTVKMKGAKSAALITFIVLAVVIIGLLGYLDTVLAAIPEASTWLSAGAYLLLSTVLFVLWLSQVLISDRMTYWRVTPGQITEVKVLGGAERTYDARGIAIDHQADDFLRHFLFGFGAGDIVLKTSGADATTIEINNVLFVRTKIEHLQALASIEPNSIEEI